MTVRISPNNVIYWLGVFFVVVVFADVAAVAQDESADSTPGVQQVDQDEEKPENENPAAAGGSAKQDEPAKRDGQADLDEAFELRISVRTTRDLDKIADLCESAITKGLDEESEKQAKKLWAGVLFEYAKQLNRQITNNGRPNTRWRLFRSQAITRLEKSLELRPGKIEALILLAKLHSLNNGNREAALEAIEKAIEQISDDNEKLSEALYIRSRLADDERSKIADLIQAVKINPDNTEALMQRALYYLSKDENDNALTDFKQLLSLEKETTDRHVIVSQALRERGMFSEAASILDLAIEQDADTDDLYVLRGQAYLAAEESEKALDDLNKALDLNRQNTDALNLRARLYLIEEDFEKSLNDANELIQLKPDEIEGLYLRSLVYRSQRKLDESIKDMQAILDKEPQNLDLKLDLAILLNANDQPSAAIPLFEEIVRVTPEEAHSQIFRNMGDAFLSQGKHQKAVDVYDTALDLLEEHKGSTLDAMSDEREQDTKVGVLNNLAWVLATSPQDEIRDGQRAIELATEASELTDYKAAYILSTLASGYAETGDFESARKWATKAVELAESEEQREGLQEELDAYKENKPWRESEDVESDSKPDSNATDDSQGKETDNKESKDSEDETDSQSEDAEDDDSSSGESDDSGDGK